MRTITTIPFGRNYSDTPQPVSVNGQTGWFSLPRNWHYRQSPDRASEVVASPNADFSPPVYHCCLADDMMTMAFQDIYVEAQSGNLNPNFKT
jgi:hypothetical protein